jgi:ribosomal protein S18 acetylase RimI-like enzyme
MSTPGFSLRRLREVDDAQVDQLADVLIDCVDGGASVSFMHPLTRDRALAFWRHVAEGVAAGQRALLVAEDGQGICGTVQLILDLPENQPHRADVCKMLVHRRARRKGLGAALMRAAESTARECGKTLLVLDAVTNGDAGRLYERLGWKKVGDIPNFALMPNGDPCSTTYYYRDLKQDREGAVGQRYRTFDELPEWVQGAVKQIRGGDERTWVSQPVPALESQSIMSLMNQGEDGERRVQTYLSVVLGKFF